MKLLPAIAAMFLLVARVCGAGGDEEEAEAPLNQPAAGVSQYLVAIADDFVVDVYQNGVAIPNSHRKLILERFGACGERINAEVKPGDWLVFHVVQNRMRWNGSKYFAVAGCTGRDEFTFVSDPASADWSACDDPAMVGEFIRNRDAGKDTRAVAIKKLWGEGDHFIRQQAGTSFNGKALWGAAASTWIKYRAPLPPPPAKVEPWNLNPRRWPVQVISAIYGTGGKDADVTAKVKEYVDKRQVFSANPPSLGADPNPYWNKGLHIVYLKDGVRREQQRNENETILPESFYGPQDAAELRAWLAETRWTGKDGEVQFHADGTFAALGQPDATRHWEAAAANRIRLTWAENQSGEYEFDYEYGSFKEDGEVFRQVK